MLGSGPKPTNETEFLKRKGMPYLESPVYPDQKEVALRCG